MDDADQPAAAGADTPVEVRDRPRLERYEATVGGAVAGVAFYRLRGDTITFTHTEVDPAFRGGRIGTQLAQYALDDARGRGLRVRPRCPFIRRYIERHPTYQDLVS